MENSDGAITTDPKKMKHLKRKTADIRNIYEKLYELEGHSESQSSTRTGSPLKSPSEPPYIRLDIFPALLKSCQNMVVLADVSSSQQSLSIFSFNILMEFTANNSHLDVTTGICVI